MLGWIFNIQFVTDLFNDGISMLFNPALCSTLCGLGMLSYLLHDKSLWRNVTRVFGIMAAVIGGLTLIEHLFRVNFGIDTLLIQREWGQNVTAAPMRMGVPASLSFALLGSSLAMTTMSRRFRETAGVFTTTSVAVCFLSMIGYWYGADTLYGIARATGIARQTSIVLIVIAIGIAAMLPEHGIAAALTRNDVGGRVFRRLLLPVVGVPVLIGAIRLRGEAAHAFDSAFGTALQTICEVLTLYTILYFISYRLSKQDAAVQDARTKLAAIVESSDDAILSVNLDGNISSWNSGAERLFGYEEQEILGQPIDKLLPADRMQEEKLVAERLVNGDRVDPFETTRIRKDGSMIDVLVTASLMRDVAGDVIGISKIVRDITERKLWEHQVLDSNRNKDIFLATLAHELRNPLTPIASAITLLSYEKSLPIESRTYVDMADRHTKQLIRLVDELLDVSRISRGKIELHKTVCKLQDIVAEALESVKSYVDESQHDLEVKIASEPIYIRADHARLTQVFTNLLNNAIKYTPHQGRLELSVRSEHDKAVFEIKDNGIGIDKNSIGRVFDLFTQIDNAYDRGRTGLGVGLSLVKQLVELHDGTIQLISDGKGRGTSAIVSLNQISPTEHHSKNGTAQHHDASAETDSIWRILVVDDMKSNTYMLSKLLEKQGHCVASANDGASALDMVESFLPNIVISDVSMPGMSGFELAGELRRRYGNSIYIIAMTGYGSEADRELTAASGFDQHLIKPPNAKVLADTLRHLKQTN